VLNMSTPIETPMDEACRLMNVTRQPCSQKASIDMCEKSEFIPRRDGSQSPPAVELCKSVDVCYDGIPRLLTLSDLVGGCDASRCRREHFKTTITKLTEKEGLLMRTKFENCTPFYLNHAVENFTIDNTQFPMPAPYRAQPNVEDSPLHNPWHYSVGGGPCGPFQFRFNTDGGTPGFYHVATKRFVNWNIDLSTGHLYWETPHRWAANYFNCEHIVDDYFIDFLETVGRRLDYPVSSCQEHEVASVMKTAEVKMPTRPKSSVC
jgi:hypothetical protein